MKLGNWKINILSNGSIYKWSKLHAIWDFLTFNGKVDGKIRQESSASVLNGKIKREFYTFRALRKHIILLLFTPIRNYIKDYRKFWLSKGFAEDQLGLIGAISFDNSTTTYNSGQTSLTISFANTGNVIIVYSWVDNSQNVTGVTYAGDALTLERTQTPGTEQLKTWYRLNPSTGTNDVVITATATPNNLAGFVGSYSGVGNVGASNEGSTTTTQLDISVTTTVDNSWLTLGTRNNQGGATTGVGSTVVRSENQDGGFAHSSLGPVTPTGATDISVSRTQSTGNFFGNALEITPSAEGATTVSRSPSGGVAVGSPHFY